MSEDKILLNKIQSQIKKEMQFTTMDIERAKLYENEFELARLRGYFEALTMLLEFANAEATYYAT